MIRHLIAMSLGLPIGAQTITFIEGTPTAATIVSVQENDPNGPVATVLQNVELLPIEITGRTIGQSGDVTRSRRLDRNGLQRVELPDGGRLFRYRRSGGAFWGFLHVNAAGAASVVVERPGLGGGADPFLDRIGVDPAGGHLAAGMQFGGLWIARLDGQNFASTGTPSRFVAAGTFVEPASVMVGASIVYFQSAGQRLFRCALADGNQPADVTPPPQPLAELEEHMAMARDGSRVVFLYGPDDLQRLWTVGSTGGATVLPPGPSDYEDPDYLPDGTGELGLLLNDDGTRLFYNDSVVGDELYLLDVTGVLPTLHITGDPIFQPTIGVHILPAYASDKLIVAIGKPGLADWFAAELGAQGGNVDNLTGTGATAPPYPEGTLNPVTSGRSANGRYFTEQNGGALVVRTIDPVTGHQAVLHQNALAAPVVGSAFAGDADVVVATAAGDRLYTNGPTALPLPLPTGLVLAAPAAGPWFSSVWIELAGAGGLGASVFYLPDGTHVVGSIEFGMQQLCPTALGGVVMNGATVRYLGLGARVVLTRPTVPWRRCLSGVGV